MSQDTGTAGPTFEEQYRVGSDKVRTTAAELAAAETGVGSARSELASLEESVTVAKEKVEEQKQDAGTKIQNAITALDEQTALLTDRRNALNTRLSEYQGFKVE